MIRRLRVRRFTRTETGLMAVAALVVCALFATFGVRQITTRKTERVETHTTTTTQAPATRAKRPDRVSSPERPVTRRSVVELRREIQATGVQLAQIRDRIREGVRAEVGKWCVAHGNCRGGRGAKGDHGADGAPGRDAAPGGRPPGSRTLDSAIVDLVDNSLSHVETTVGTLLSRVDSLTGRITILENVLAGLCRILTPGRCPS